MCSIFAEDIRKREKNILNRERFKKKPGNQSSSLSSRSVTRFRCLASLAPPCSAYHHYYYHYHCVNQLSFCLSPLLLFFLLIVIRICWSASPAILLIIMIIFTVTIMIIMTFAISEVIQHIPRVTHPDNSPLLFVLLLQHFQAPGLPTPCCYKYFRHLLTLPVNN